MAAALEIKLTVLLHSLHDRLAKDLAKDRFHVAEVMSQSVKSVNEHVTATAMLCAELEDRLSTKLYDRLSQLQSELSAGTVFLNGPRGVVSADYTVDADIKSDVSADRVLHESTALVDSASPASDITSAAGKGSSAHSCVNDQVVEALSGVVLESVKAHESFQHVDQQYQALKLALTSVVARLDKVRAANVSSEDLCKLRDTLDDCVTTNQSVSFEVRQQRLQHNRDYSTLTQRLENLEQGVMLMDSSKSRLDAHLAAGEPPVSQLDPLKPRASPSSWSRSEPIDGPGLAEVVSRLQELAGAGMLSLQPEPSALSCNLPRREAFEPASAGIYRFEPSK
jgi:hypothetical protein